MRFHRPRRLTTRPTVSVVVPCHNYSEYLPDAVTSALDQDDLDVDVLVVDDASTDGSLELARALAAADSRIEVLSHEENTGHIRTYNDGLAKASGGYVVLLSADDVLPRNALTRAVALMEHHPSVGLVYGYAKSFVGRPEPVPDVTRSWSVWPGRQWLRRAARTGRNFLVSPEAVMRREALFDTDLYDVRLPHSGDFDMWLRTAARWDVGRVNGPVQAHYRVHDANMHLTSYGGWLTDLQARRLTFDILFDERAADLPEVTRLRPVAARALVREALHRARLAAGDPDSRQVAEYLTFAEDVSPGVTRTIRSRGANLVRTRGHGHSEHALLRQMDRARHHVAWQRERRYGV